MSSKRMKFSNGGGESARVFDYSDPFTIPDLLESINSGKYGSVTKDVEALVERKMQVFHSLFAMCPDLEYNVNGEVSDVVSKDVVDLESAEAKCIVPTTDPVVIIESDEEEDVDRKPFHHFQEIAFPRPTIGLLTDNMLVRFP